MKLYVRDGEVYFDYSDIDDTDFKGEQTRHKNEFLRGSAYSRRKWDRTLKPKVLKMRVSNASWMSEYENASNKLSEIKAVFNSAEYSEYIEIADGFEAHIKELEAECEELFEKAYALEQERRQKQELEAKWNRLCKNGCGNCEHKCAEGDDFRCAYTGELLKEENRPAYNRYGVYCMYNYVAIPSDNCPYNTNKKEKDYERLSEVSGSAAEA